LSSHSVLRNCITFKEKKQAFYKKYGSLFSYFPWNAPHNPDPDPDEGEPDMCPTLALHG